MALGFGDDDNTPLLFPFSFRFPFRFRLRGVWGLVGDGESFALELEEAALSRDGVVEKEIPLLLLSALLLVVVSGGGVGEISCFFMAWLQSISRRPYHNHLPTACKYTVFLFSSPTKSNNVCVGN